VGPVGDDDGEGCASARPTRRTTLSAVNTRRDSPAAKIADQTICVLAGDLCRAKAHEPGTARRLTNEPAEEWLRDGLGWPLPERIRWPASDFRANQVGGQQPCQRG